MGRIPIDDNHVYWFLIRPWLTTDAETRKDAKLIREATKEAIKGFPYETIEMVRNADLGSLHHAILKYQAPWDLFGSFRKGTMTVSGDAMHTFSPFLGQGGSASLEDAVVLVRCLARVRTLSPHGEYCEGRARDEIEKAFDKFAKKRRSRLLKLSLQTYLSEWRMGTSSIVKKFAFGVMLRCFFNVPLGHTQYDCGPL